MSILADPSIQWNACRPRWPDKPQRSIRADPVRHAQRAPRSGTIRTRVLQLAPDWSTCHHTVILFLHFVFVASLQTVRTHCFVDTCEMPNRSYLDSHPRQRHEWIRCEAEQHDPARSGPAAKSKIDAPGCSARSGRFLVSVNVPKKRSL